MNLPFVSLRLSGKKVIATKARRHKEIINEFTLRACCVKQLIILTASLQVR